MKPGDLVVTRDMGTGSGKIGLVVKSKRSKIAVSPTGERPVKYRIIETCDVLLRGELIDGIDTHFLRKIEQNETGAILSYTQRRKKKVTSVSSSSAMTKNQRTHIRVD